MKQIELERGAGLPATAVAKIEREERRRAVTVDDLLAIALVLNVSPADLLLPHEGSVRIAGQEFEAADVRGWLEGKHPLPHCADDSEQARDYFAEASEYRRQAHATWRHPAVVDTEILLMYLRDAILTGGRREGMSPGALVEGLRKQLRRLTTQLELVIENLESAGEDRR